MKGLQFLHPISLLFTQLVLFTFLKYVKCEASFALFAVKKVDAQEQHLLHHFRPMAAVTNVWSISCFANVLVPATLVGDDIDNTNGLAAVEASIQIDFFLCHGADNPALLHLKYVKCEDSFALFCVKKVDAQQQLQLHHFRPMATVTYV
jgi:hypothetical protein